MDVSRRGAGVKTSVAAGSVWGSRMKLDGVKGGIKVFNGEEKAKETADTAPRKLVKKGPIGASVSTSGKRKTWKSESFDGAIQSAKGKTKSTSIRNCEERSREMSVSVDGIKKTPIQARKERYEGSKDLSLSVDGIDKSPIQVKKARSEANKEVGLSLDGNGKSPIQTRKARSDTKEVVESGVLQLRKSKSDSVDIANQSGKDLAADNGNERNPVQLMKSMSEVDKVLDESVSNKAESLSEIEKNPPAIEETGTEESCKEFGVCQEKVISSSESSKAIVKSPPKLLVVDDNDDDDEDVMDDDEEFEGDEDLEEEIVIEVENKSFDVKEIDIPEEKPKKVEIDIPEQKYKKVVEIGLLDQKPKKIVNEEKEVHKFSDRTVPTSSIVYKQPPPAMKRATIYHSSSNPTSAPISNGYKSFPETQGKLQNLADLVMWRDVSRSAFVFGIGAFVIISSSYTKDLNVSFISVISYLGLFYLAAIFLFRSLISRVVHSMDDDDTSYVLGEDEAFWLVKLVLPYLNEFLLKIRALFCGDSATTMKMAVLLFVLARCGSSLTIWKMAKLGFLGVFTVPKVCSFYSAQLTAYGKFWIRRFSDAWESCTHKKAVALAVFTLVWNLSSMVARIWSVFMMFVAVRYYQQTMHRDDCVDEDEEADGEQCNELEERRGGEAILTRRQRTWITWEWVTNRNTKTLSKSLSSPRHSNNVRKQIKSKWKEAIIEK